MVAMAHKFNILPPMGDEEFAEDTDGIFLSSDCPDGVVTIRKGRVKHRRLGVVECCMACRKGDDWGYALASKEDGVWVMKECLGGSMDSINAAFIEVVGVIPE